MLFICQACSFVFFSCFFLTFPLNIRVYVIEQDSGLKLKRVNNHAESVCPPFLSEELQRNVYGQNEKEHLLVNKSFG